MTFKLFICAAFLFSVPAMALAQNAAPKKALPETQAPATAPNAKAPKSNAPKSNTKNLDSFFKKAEEQTRKAQEAGDSNCVPKAEPKVTKPVS